MGPKAEVEKEKKEKKEDKEKKEKKEDKEKKEKKEKEDGEKKKPKRLEAKEAVGFSAWDDVGDTSKVDKPQDKREKEQAKAKKNETVVVKTNFIEEDMKKMQEAKRKEQKAKEEEAKKKEKEKKNARASAAEDREEYEIMDNDGLGNNMPKEKVQDIMKNTVPEASSSSDSRCVASTKTKMGDLVFKDKKTQFASYGTKGRSREGEEGE